MQEIWKPVVGFETTYEISDQGRIKRTSTQRILAPRNCTNGYKMVNLKDGKNYKQRMIHSLVAEAFIGPRPEGMVVSHKNHVKHNNPLNNLEYVTYAENSRLSARRGENHASHKLTEKDIRLAKAMKEYGLTLWFIAHEFQCSISHLSSIISGKTRVLA